MAEDQEKPDSVEKRAVAEAERIIKGHQDIPGIPFNDSEDDTSMLIENLPQPPEIGILPTDSLSARHRRPRLHKPQK